MRRDSVLQPPPAGSDGRTWPRWLFLLLAAVPGQAAPEARQRPGTDVARQQIEAAEHARAAQVAAQREATARAEAAAVEERRVGRQLVSAAARLREAENALAEAASRMDALARRREQAEVKLQSRAEDLAPLLPVIQRLSLYPAETMLALPAEPEDGLRGVLILHGIAREIDQQAAALRREQAEVDAAAQAMRAESPKLASAEAAQAAQAAALDGQLAAARASRREAEGEAEDAARRAAEQAGRADSLRAAIAEIEADRRAEEARARKEALVAERQKREGVATGARRRQEALARPAGLGSLVASATPRGQLTVPVAGTVIRPWGAATEAGPATGLSYRAAPGARVVSPCGGRVVFAGPFRSYGLLLIVDCGGGYHFVLAGLDRLDVSVGNAVQAGEPVGVMPGWNPRVPGNRPALYVELRRGGQPVDPAPWLVARG